MNISIEKLNLLLANNVMPMAKLSELSGISCVTLTRIKSGKQKPRPQTLGKIAKALGVKVEDLV